MVTPLEGRFQPDFDGVFAHKKTLTYDSYRLSRGTHGIRHASYDSREAAWAMRPFVESIMSISHS